MTAKLGFNEKRIGPSALYFSIFDGCICEKSKTAKKDFEGPRTTMNPETKTEVYTYVKRYDSLVANIIGCEKHTGITKSGKKINSFNITLLAGDKKGVLQLDWIGGPLKRFFKVAPNIDFEKPIRISVFYSFNEKGDKKLAIAFNQGDSDNIEEWPKVGEYYNRNNPEMPEAVLDEDEDTWDFKEQNKFLVQKFKENTMPIIEAIAERYKGIVHNSGPSDVREEEEHEVTVPEFSGPAVTETQKTEYSKTEKPLNPVAVSLTDLVSAAQMSLIRNLATEKGLEAEAACEFMLGANLSEISKRAASYMIETIKAMPMDDSIQTQAQEINVPASQPLINDDDIPWG